MKKNFGHTLQTNVALFRYNYKDAQIPLSIAATDGGIGLASRSSTISRSRSAKGSNSRPFGSRSTTCRSCSTTPTSTPTSPAPRAPSIPSIRPALDPQARPIITAGACQAAVGAPAACSADAFTVGLPNGGFQRGQDLNGQSLPNAPKNKVAVNVNYTWDLPGGSLSPSLSYVWRDKQYGSIFNRSYYQSPSYDQWDARATWKSEDKKYSIIGFIRNIGNTLGYEGGAGAGRRAGVVPAYVTRTIPAGGSATTPVSIVQGTTSSYTLTPPRTFGVELQYRFF